MDADYPKEQKAATLSRHRTTLSSTAAKSKAVYICDLGHNDSHSLIDRAKKGDGIPTRSHWPHPVVLRCSVYRFQISDFFIVATCKAYHIARPQGFMRFPTRQAEKDGALL